MLNIFKEVEKLRREINLLEEERELMWSEIKSAHKKLNSRAYNNMVGRYEAKEKRFCKKAFEIIMSSEKPKVNEDSAFGWNKTVEYKNLCFFINRKDLIVTYRNFTFNEENSKMLYDLYESLN